jgi:hypothetical protein
MRGFVTGLVGVGTWVLIAMLAERQLHLARAIAEPIGYTASWMVGSFFWRSRSPEVPFLRYVAFALAGGLVASAAGMVLFK